MQGEEKVLATAAISGRTATTIRDAIETGIRTKVITLGDPEEYTALKDLLECIERIYSLADNTPPGLLFSLAFNDCKYEVTIKDAPSAAPGTGIKQCLDTIALNINLESYLAAPEIAMHFP